MPTEEQDVDYLFGEAGDTRREVERLQKQHAWVQTCLKGKLVFAPVNLKTEGIKILDMGCADGGF